MILPFSSKNSMRSPVFSLNLSRIAFGIVNWPLLVTVAAGIEITLLTYRYILT